MSSEKGDKDTNDDKKELSDSTDKPQLSQKSSLKKGSVTLKAKEDVWVEQFAELYADLDSADVSIFCGSSADLVRAHRYVLSFGSVYFKEALEMAPSKHPAIVVKNINGDEMRRIREYLYFGQITLKTDGEFSNFLSSAKYLQLVGIRGCQCLVNY